MPANWIDFLGNFQFKFILGKMGIFVKNNSGTLEARNNGDTAYVPIGASTAKVYGSNTTYAVGFTAPTLSSGYTLTMPSALPAGSSKFITDNAGNVTFVTDSAAGTQNANTVNAGPTSGAAATPTFRALVQADIPPITIPYELCQGRLGGVSGNPTGEVGNSANTLYWVPMTTGDRVGFYESSAWKLYHVAQCSLDISGTSAGMYDVFLDSSPALYQVAWTNTTTRATALDTQDSIYVQNGHHDRRFVASYYNIGYQTQDGIGPGAASVYYPQRLIWNMYNRIARPVIMYVTGISSYVWSGTGFRQVHADTNSKIQIVSGLPNETVLTATVHAATSLVSGSVYRTNLSLDSTIQFDGYRIGGMQVGNGAYDSISGGYAAAVPVGLHNFNWLEYTDTSGSLIYSGRDTGVIGSVIL
jgi:hypothetical protein